MRRFVFNKVSLFHLTCALSMGLLCATCSSKQDDGKSDREAGDTEEPSVDIGNGAGSVQPGAKASFVSLDDGTCELTIGDDVCTGQDFENKYVPLDLLVMLDQSGSMCSCVSPPVIGGACPDPDCAATRMDAIREAISKFVAAPESAGIGIGIGYFGQQAIGAADCRAQTYASPSVEIADLPDNATRIMQSLSAATPIGETPTASAIEGACSYARNWQKANSDHKTAILLVTDGEPKAPVSCPTGSEECCPTLASATSAAASCLAGAPGIQTYVLGVGPYLQNLDGIALAGGSEHAYLVEGDDVATRVLETLNAIRSDAAIPCEFPIPLPDPGEEAYDVSQINIAYADQGCNGELFYYVSSATECTQSGGWYYDDPSDPSTVRLCPTTCSEVAAPGGRLYFSIGCATVVVVK
jgi:hypothetical protein